MRGFGSAGNEVGRIFVRDFRKLLYYIILLYYFVINLLFCYKLFFINIFFNSKMNILENRIETIIFIIIIIGLILY